MKKVLAMVAVVAFGLTFAACDKKDAAKDSKPAASAVKKTEKKAAAASSDFDKIGVAECDEYVAKYAACIKKMPSAAQGTAMQGLKTQVSAWKQAASNDAAKAALATGCKQALEAVKGGMGKAYNCEW